jgi:hypothetical protein
VKIVFLPKIMILFTIAAGPFKINGVPLRRVNQSYVIGTSTKVDISGVNVEKFDDKYFGKKAEKKKKKGEGNFFEADKEVCLLVVISYMLFHSIYLCSLLHPEIFDLLFPNYRVRMLSHKRRRMTRRQWMHRSLNHSSVFQI